MPAGCSATVWNEDSCLVSAGHCINGNDVVQMRVPASNPDCSLNHPPVSEQFPILETIFVNNGPGNDWSTMQAGENDLGETPIERYGVYRSIRPSPPQVGLEAVVFGFGIDGECTRSQTQQVSDGVINSVQTLLFFHDVDTTFGNSGSSLLVDEEITGIATHCTCPTNTATRIDHPAFTAARRELCRCVGDANFDGLVNFTDILKVLANWGLPGGPSDLNDDGIIDFADILVVLANWGEC
jgi:V8-like Glu-specific endopeptidase